MLALFCVTALFFGGCGENEQTECTVRFCQTGYETIIRKVKKGEALTDIPEPKQVEGKEIIWNYTEFSCITTDLTVTAIEKSNYCKITFKQEGQADVVKIVKKGESLTDIPEPKEVDGKEMIWDCTDFSKITADLIVTAIEKANSCKITFKQEGQPDVVKIVKKGESLTDIPEPKEVDGKEMIWDCTDFSKITADLIVTAIEKANSCKITFKQEGQPDVVKIVKKGESLTDIPEPKQSGRFITEWDRSDFSEITEDIVVNAKTTDNYRTFTITLKTGFTEEQVPMETTTIKVVYGEKFTLPVPKYVKDGSSVSHEFEYWKNEETNEKVTDGKYNFEQDLVLVACWGVWAGPW